ncbi:hypothetical protein KPH14_012996 [Odynerus spinipes]|uniref:CCHC-type domain-containing protein n=1 Tax=Odynerus spinipes TaxID=1348599 RepID=A0AAD9R7V3_9HYME|nr:hypothetical protein KPH14_012996 [Odynerus spinipes]
MDRLRLDEMSLSQLKEEALKYGLPILEDRNAIIDSLMTHFERNSPAAEMLPTRRDQNHSTAPSPLVTLQDDSSLNPDRLQRTSILADFTSNINSQLQLMRQSFLYQQQQQNDLILEMRRELSRLQPSTATAASTSFSHPTIGNVRGHDSSHRTSGAGASSAHAVTLLATQIPEYGGTEDENVQLWIKRVEQVARIHSAVDDVVLLAASSRLTKAARRWFDLGTGSMIESWSGFRESILKRFTRKVLYHVAIQRVEARMWNHAKESFLEYAMDKLALIHHLNLPEDSIIHLLTGGLGNMSLRAIATSLKVNSVDEFLDAMHQITSVTYEGNKASSSNSKEQKPKTPTCDTCGKMGHHQRQCRKNLQSCVYCKASGHQRENCPKLKAKERASPSAPQNRPTVATVSNDQDDQEKQTVAFVQPEVGITLLTDYSPFKIIKLNNNECSLIALLDTGSPISFVRLDVYEKFLKGREINLSPPRLSYKALNNKPIDILGSVTTSVCLQQLRDLTLPICLHVLKDNAIATHLILGRDFLEDQKITLKYVSSDSNNFNTFPKSLLQILASLVDDKEEDKLNETSIDYDLSTLAKLKNLIKEVDNSKIDIIDDNYQVTVKLKDDSVYAYAPRRFAWAERIQIREITDDLLQRGIIKSRETKISIPANRRLYISIGK